MDVEQEIQALKQVNELLLRSMVQSGTVLSFAGAKAPNDEWLICDGTAISRVGYATLFKVIGETYGSGDGSTTFNLPDLRGRTAIGAGQATGLTERIIGQAIGEENHILSVDEIPSHSHSGKTEPGGKHDHSEMTEQAGEHSHSAKTENGGKHSHLASVAANGGHSHSASASGTATVSNFATSPFSGRGFASVPSSGGGRGITPSGQEPQFNAHVHNVTVAPTGNHSHTVTVNDFADHQHRIENEVHHQHRIKTENDHEHSIPSEGRGQIHNNIQPSLVLNYIIKT